MGINASIRALPIPSVPPVITTTLSLKNDMLDDYSAKITELNGGKKLIL
jgi:hypothetical protein